MLFKSKDPDLPGHPRQQARPSTSATGKYTEPEVRTLTTTLSSGDRAPYLLLGFGSMSTTGLSITADIGVVRLSGAELTMVATGDEAAAQVERVPRSTWQLEERRNP